MAEEKQKFHWTGINTKGGRTSGVIKAADTKSALMELKKIGIEVVSLQEKKHSFTFNLPSFKKKIKRKDILLFTRYLSTTLSAGLSVVQSLDIIGAEQTNPNMQNLVMTVKNNVATGKTLSESIAQFPDAFGDLYVSLVKAGEKSGTLDKILIRIGNYLERSEALRRKITKALIYPIAIFSIAILVSLVLLIFVVPRFETMFTSFGAKLPLFTRIVVDFSKILRTYWWLLGIIIVGGIFGLRAIIKSNPRIRNSIDHYLLKVYLIGPVLRNSNIARYTRTLATTLDAGMPIMEGMKFMAPIMSSHEYSEAVLAISRDVVAGHQLSSAMASTKLFPSLAIQMIAVGEVSGSLPVMLNKVADNYEEEVNAIVDNLSTLLEPVIMLVLGVIVGAFIIAMYLPIFKLGSLY